MHDKSKSDDELPKPSKEDEKPRGDRSTRSSVKKDQEDESSPVPQPKGRRGRKPKNFKEEVKDDEEELNKSISDSGAIDAAQLKKATGRKLPITKVNQKRGSSSKNEVKDGKTN